MPVAAGPPKRPARPARPPGVLWAGLFFLALFGLLALLQRPPDGFGLSGRLPTPSPIEPAWSYAAGPSTRLAQGGETLGLLGRADGGDPTLTLLDRNGVVKSRRNVAGATMVGAVGDRLALLNPSPPALGLPSAAHVSWIPIEAAADLAAPRITQAAFGPTKGVLVLLSQGPQPGPEDLLVMVSLEGRTIWKLKVPDAIVTALWAGPQGGALVAAYTPSPQPRAWVIVLGLDGATVGRFEVGSDPLYRVAMDPAAQSALAVDSRHVWLIQLATGSLRQTPVDAVVAVAAPLSAEPRAGADFCVATQTGSVISIAGGQTNWRRQLAGPAVDLIRTPSGGLIVAGEDRLYLLSQTGKGRLTVSLPDRPRQLLLLQDQGQVVVAAGSKLLAYDLPADP